MVHFSPVALAAPGAALAWPSLRCRSCLTCVVVAPLVPAWACPRSRPSLVPGRLSVLVSPCLWLRWWRWALFLRHFRRSHPRRSFASTSSRLLCPRRLPGVRRPLRSAVPQHEPQATLTRPTGAARCLSQGAPVASELGVPSGVVQWRGCWKLPYRSPRHSRLSSLLGHCEWPWSCSSRARLRGPQRLLRAAPVHEGALLTPRAHAPWQQVRHRFPLTLGSRRLRPRARGPHGKCEKKLFVVLASTPSA